ncbi:Cytochrome c oxidase assembly protein cox19 [Pestalotiopsis sp. IQ-011]
MWKPKGAHRLSRSNGSSSYQPLLDDDDKAYLPDSDVYVTTTSSGRPAIARKKNSDHGFDFLSEAFGIPSRPSPQRGRRHSNLVQQSRSKSAYSTPTPRVIELDSDYEELPESKVQGSSSRSPARSKSALKSILRNPQPAPVDAELRQPREYPPSSSRATLKKRRSHTFSHPPESERMRFAEDDDSDEDGSVADSSVPLYHQNGIHYTPLAPQQFHPNAAAMPGGLQQFPGQNYLQSAWPSGFSQASASVGSLSVNLNAHQAQSFGGQVPYAQSMTFQQPGIMLPMGQVSHMETTAFSYPQQGFVPPPPPPPPPPAFVPQPFDTIPLVESSTVPDPGQDRIHDSVKPRVSRDERPHTENNPEKIQHEGAKDSKKQKKSTRENQDQASPVLSIMQMHICAGCGKTRSKGYHMTHPLKKGEKPEPGYCRRCIVTADYTDSEVTESGLGSDFPMTPIFPVGSRSRGHDSPISSTVKSNKSSSRKNSQKDQNKRSSFLQAVSSMISNGRRSRRTNSLSTPEEGSDRASSPTGEPRVRRPGSRSSKTPSTKDSHTRSSLRRLVESESRTTLESVPFESREESRSGSRDKPLAREYDPLPSETPSRVTGRSKHSHHSGSARPNVKNFSYKPSRRSPRKTSPLLPPSGSQGGLSKSQSGSLYQHPVAHNEASEIERSEKPVSIGESSRNSGKVAAYDREGSDGQIDPVVNRSREATAVDQLHRSASPPGHTAFNLPKVRTQLNGSQVSEGADLLQSRDIFGQVPDFDMPASDQGADARPGSGSHAAESRIDSNKSYRDKSSSKPSSKRSSERVSPVAPKGDDQGYGFDAFDACFDHPTQEREPFILPDFELRKDQHRPTPGQSEKRSSSNESESKSKDACDVELPRSNGSSNSSRPSATSSRGQTEAAGTFDNPFGQRPFPNDDFAQSASPWGIPSGNAFCS